MSNQMNLSVRAVISIALVFLALSACTPNEEEMASTSLAETIAAASPTLKPTATSAPTDTLTPTETPTATPSPTNTATPIPILGDMETYYPHADNMTWWYGFTIDGESNGLSSFSFTGEGELDDGRPIFILKNTENLNALIEMEAQAISEESVLLHQTVTVLKSSEPRAVSFDPPIPILNFPLEHGATWSHESGEFEVTYLESVSVHFGDFQDCFRVDRIRNDIIDYKSWYCPEVGRVLIEHLAGDSWARLELIAMASARIEVEEIVDSGEDCFYKFEILGFSSMEEFDFIVHLPDDESFVAVEDFPLADNTILSYPIHPQDPTGFWFWEFIGSEHYAVYMFYWTGECR